MNTYKVWELSDCEDGSNYQMKFLEDIEAEQLVDACRGAVLRHGRDRRLKVYGDKFAVEIDAVRDYDVASEEQGFSELEEVISNLEGEYE